MSGEWEKVSEVPVGTLVRIRGLSIHFTCTGKVEGYRFGYGLDLNVPAIDGERGRLIVNSRRALVYRVPLLPRL